MPTAPTTLGGWIFLAVFMFVTHFLADLVYELVKARRNRKGPKP